MHFKFTAVNKTKTKSQISGRGKTYRFYIQGISFQGGWHFCDFFLQSLERKQAETGFDPHYLGDKLTKSQSDMHPMLSLWLNLDKHGRSKYVLAGNSDILWVEKRHCSVSTHFRVWYIPASIRLQGIWLLGWWSSWAGAGFPCPWLAPHPQTLCISYWTGELRRSRAKYCNKAERPLLWHYRPTLTTQTILKT